VGPTGPTGVTGYTGYTGTQGPTVFFSTNTVALQPPTTSPTGASSYDAYYYQSSGVDWQVGGTGTPAPSPSDAYVTGADLWGLPLGVTLTLQGASIFVTDGANALQYDNTSLTVEVWLGEVGSDGSVTLFPSAPIADYTFNGSSSTTASFYQQQLSFPQFSFANNYMLLLRSIYTTPDTGYFSIGDPAFQVQLVTSFGSS